MNPVICFCACLPTRPSTATRAPGEHWAATACWLIELHGDKATGVLDDSIHEMLDRAIDRTAADGTR